MQVNNYSVSKIFSHGGSIHYILPPFQREYTWSKDEWQTIMTDALAIYDEYDPEKEPEHFLGSIVVIDGGRVGGTIPVSILVDGQQRLTTITLMLCALRDVTHEQQPQLAKKIHKIITNDDEAGDIQLKLLPTTKYGDRLAYHDIVLKVEHTKCEESSIPAAYQFFYGELLRRIAAGVLNVERFFVVLVNCFQLVLIELNRDESPYQIFESLNAKGKRLSQADLVRNYIAMKLPASKQEELFTSAWEVIEGQLQEKRTVARLGELTAFIRHYLAMETNMLCSEDHIYARFRDRMEKSFSEEHTFIAEIQRLKRFASYYDRLLHPKNEINPDIQGRLQRLNIMEISTAYPFLLAAYDAYSSQVISFHDFINVLDILENYMVRRYLANEQTSYLNKMFPTLWREVKMKEQTMPFIDALKKVLSTKNCPKDRRIQEAAYARNVYRSSSKLAMIFERINQYLSREHDGYAVLNDEPTIEHIMPQVLIEDWKSELGEQWEQVHQDYLNTLGNLTIVTQSYNSSLSNIKFAEKKKAFAVHILRINALYFAQEIPAWNEESIKLRAEFLVKHILLIWPSLGDITLEQHQQRGSRPKTLVIRHEQFNVRLWRDVVHQVAEYCVLYGSFELLLQASKTNFTNDPSLIQKSAGWSLLSNGWYVHVYMDRSTAKRLCQRMLQTLHISENEWRVIEDDSHDSETMVEEHVLTRIDSTKL